MANELTLVSSTNTEAEVKAALELPDRVARNEARSKPPEQQPLLANIAPETPTETVVEPAAEPIVESTGVVEQKADKVGRVKRVNTADPTPPVVATDTVAEPEVETPAEEAKSEEKPEVEAKPEKAKKAKKAAPKATEETDEDESRPANKRIRQLVHDNAVLRAQLEAKPTPATPDSKAHASEELAKKPVQAEFETYDDYMEALASYTAKKAVDERVAADRTAHGETVQREREQAVLVAYNKRLAAQKPQYPDFDEIVEASKAMPVSTPMRDVILQSEHGPALLYYFASNPQECVELAAASPGVALLKLGRLEAKAEAGTLINVEAAPEETVGDVIPAVEPDKPVTARHTPVSRAPAPMPRVGSSAGSVSTVSPDTMGYREYKAWRQQQRQAKGLR